MAENQGNLVDSVVGISDRGSISSMRDMGGLNGFTGGLGDLVVDIATGNLGDGVAVLNLNWDKLDLGVVNAMLGSHFTTSVLDGSGDGVSNSMGSNWSNSKRSSSEGSSNGMSIRMSSEELGISLSLSFSFTLSNGMVTKSRGSNSGSITDGVNDFLAHLLIFDLLGVNGLCGANILGSRDTSLGHKDLNLSDTVSSGNCVVGGSSKELGISICIRGRGSAGKGKEARNSKNLHHDEIVRYFPRWLVELK